MKKSKLKSKLLAGCSISAIALMTSMPNVATAQQPEENEATAQQPRENLVVEEVLVTALKRETSIQDVPLAITALSGDFTRDVNLNDMKDLILWTPGFTGNSQDSFIDAVSVRGILTNDFGVGGDPSIGFFKNNLYMGRNGVAITSLYDMDRAEALRGPQGFLFGRNAIGGAISVFTKRPDLNSNGGYAEFDAGQRGHYVGEAAINLSSNDNFGVRIAGYYSTENGYVDNVFRPADPRRLAHEKFGIRGTALYENENISAALTVEYEDRNQDGTTYRAIAGSSTFQRLNDLFGVTVGGNGRDIDQDLGFNDIADDSEIFTIGFQLDWDLGGVTLTSITGYTDHSYFYVEDFDGTNLQINDYLQDQKGNYFQQEIRLASDTDEPLSWYGGVSFYKENINAFFSEKSNEGIMCAYYFAPYYEGYPYYYTGASAAYYGLLGCQYYYYNNSPYDDPLNGELIEDNRAIGHYKGWGAYVNLNYAFSDKFDIGVGVRYTKDTKEFSIEGFPVASNLGPFFALGFTTAEPLIDTRSWSAFTPQFVVRYRPNDNTMLFASATRGFKSGGFGSFSVQELAGQPELPFGVTGLTNNDARPDDFAPERAWSYEIGIKGTTHDGRIRYDANAYYYTYKDMQLFVVGLGGGTRVDNVGFVKGYGFEGSMQWVVSQYVDLRFSAAHASTKLSGAQPICPGPDPDACEGASLSHVPDLSGAARINFRYPVNGGYIRAAAELYGQTKTSALSASTDPAEVIDAYADISLRFGYESNNGWAITAYVENVTNALYYDGIFAGDGILPSVWFNASRPRSFGVRISTSFGGER
ncbi:MAG: TonB-dependent receptor [Proteobacteria bacterium]|nr:TonB-dependent receptor [Pseudomonadota bacterium]